MECAKEINAVAVKGPTTCLAPACYADFLLPHSKHCNKHCKQCILKAELSSLRIDKRDAEAVLAIEREAVTGIGPKTQNMPWNYCRICLETALQPGESWQELLTA